MKKLLALGAAGAVFASLAFASAAGLPIDDTPQTVVQAATISDLVCQDTPVTVEGFGVELDTMTGHFLQLSGIESGCEGADLGVKIENGSGGQLFKGGFVIQTGGDGEQNFNFGPGIPLDQIEVLKLVVG